MICLLRLQFTLGQAEARQTSLLDSLLPDYQTALEGAQTRLEATESPVQDRWDAAKIPADLEAGKSLSQEVVSSSWLVLIKWRLMSAAIPQVIM